ncbi:hypothetical protein Pcinc_008766 [Petrolisthes cinctipes]|uniref:Uncharacterized protein n=1 Tax=Petrolisthes cinctipes TaxID=88211 RepID=A0AAE1G6Q7_PETCI|nr:hypothetical protein Pcinc_008766 [Petrolisthes cinctipes]
MFGGSATKVIVMWWSETAGRDTQVKRCTLKGRSKAGLRMEDKPPSSDPTVPGQRRSRWSASGHGVNPR